MDWDKIRIFHTTAEAGSMTRAADVLGLSQSAVSRQISALEAGLQLSLFQRHARGLLLTEQGEMLYRAARELVKKIDGIRDNLTDSRKKPSGPLRVTANVGLGSYWVLSRIEEFVSKYPDIQLQFILTDGELNLEMREADVALRLREPEHLNLIRRKLFIVHFHAYASQEYLRSHEAPQIPEDLDQHRLLAFGGDIPENLRNINWHLSINRPSKTPRVPSAMINNLTGLLHMVQSGLGIAVLPDYIVAHQTNLIQLLNAEDMPTLECYLVYSEAMKGVTRVQVFRDFMIGKAQKWFY